MLISMLSPACSSLLAENFGGVIDVPENTTLLLEGLVGFPKILNERSDLLSVSP